MMILELSSTNGKLSLPIIGSQRVICRMDKLNSIRLVSCTVSCERFRTAEELNLPLLGRSWG